MPKPWAKYEVGFINHDKFRAISGNAICLWIEGKNYADEKLTDGILPSYEVKHWRFFSRKALTLLTTSIGRKPGTAEDYAPLWREHPLGWAMHDYLDHNECRDKAVERIARSEAAKKADRDRKAAARDAKDAKADAARIPSGIPTLVSVHEPDTGPDSDSKQKAEIRNHASKEHSQPDARSKRPMFTGRRLTVFEWMVDDLSRLLGSFTDEFDLHAWFFELDERASAERMVVPQRDGGKWLQEQTLAEAQRRGLPIAVASAAPTLGKLSSRMAAMVAGGKGGS